MSSATNYLIVHGAFGSPQENWFPWLADKLRLQGDKVFAPQFPTPKDQNLQNWQKVAVDTLKNCLPAETVVIGHSSGAGFVLRLAEQTLQPYKALFAICPFMRALGLPEFDPLNKSFVEPEPDWGKIKRGARKIACFAGDNDPYVPLAFSHHVADRCGADFTVIEKGGHLNAAAGFTEFPLLLEKITQLS